VLEILPEHSDHVVTRVATKIASFRHVTLLVVAHQWGRILHCSVQLFKAVPPTVTTQLCASHNTISHRWPVRTYLTLLRAIVQSRCSTSDNAIMCFAQHYQPSLTSEDVFYIVPCNYSKPLLHQSQRNYVLRNTISCRSPVRTYFCIAPCNYSKPLLYQWQRNYVLRKTSV